MRYPTKCAIVTSHFPRVPSCPGISRRSPRRTIGADTGWFKGAKGFSPDTQGCNLPSRECSPGGTVNYDRYLSN